jgi:CheY-like chemotaxis protein
LNFLHNSKVATLPPDDYVIATAGNGTEALPAVMQDKPALVVTDIVRPAGTGSVFTVRLPIVQQDPSTPGAREEQG